jgi:hypothetical protein
LSATCHWGFDVYFKHRHYRFAHHIRAAGLILSCSSSKQQRDAAMAEEQELDLSNVRAEGNNDGQYQLDVTLDAFGVPAPRSSVG